MDLRHYNIALALRARDGRRDTDPIGTPDGSVPTPGPHVGEGGERGAECASEGIGVPWECGREWSLYPSRPALPAALSVGTIVNAKTRAHLSRVLPTRFHA